MDIPRNYFEFNTFSSLSIRTCQPTRLIVFVVNGVSTPIIILFRTIINEDMHFAPYSPFSLKVF